MTFFKANVTFVHLTQNRLVGKKIKMATLHISSQKCDISPKALLGFNIYMKPNEAQCEENQGVRGEKIPPPTSEFETPVSPLGFSGTLIWILTGFDNAKKFRRGLRMSKAIENLMKAQKIAMQNRPKIGGFPYLAEVLRQSGVIRNIWSLPSCQSLFSTKEGPVVMQGEPLVTGTVDVPKFDQEALIKALRIDQAGKSTFPEFLKASWRAGVVSYDVDFAKRTVTYFGCEGEKYEEEYPAVHIEVQQ